MARKKFTPEEMETLRQNPYTAKVTPGQISFTKEFKQAFWEASLAGEKPPDIMGKLGYDVTLLGEKRVAMVAQRVREEARSGEGFYTGRRPYGSRKTSGNDDSAALGRRVAYLEEQMAFIKNVLSARTSAQ